MRCVLSTLIFSSLVSVSAQDLTVPAHTVYLDPDNGGARVSAEQGITRWKDPNCRALWFGQFRNTGELKIAAKVRLKHGGTARLSLKFGELTKEADISSAKDEALLVDFGTAIISATGYHRIELSLKQPAANIEVEVSSLQLSGPAAESAHFNLKPRRNAASVHLAYPVESGAKVDAFYCEMKAVEDPIWSYYMACGWHRGYFGMQVNSPTERRIIFSVWDSGNEAVDRNKVEDQNRVKLVGKGEGVYSGSFGNEGTGGHSHLKFNWKTGETQRFLVTSEPVDETHTVYAGYYFRPDTQKWMLISSWNAPKEGGYMRGLYSFSENFVGRNGHLLRKALYGNQWVRTSDGQWHELTTAKFSHDPTGREDRRDRFMGLEDGQFFLSHGGFVDGYTNYGTPFQRPASGRSPETMDLPDLPPVKR